MPLVIDPKDLKMMGIRELIAVEKVLKTVRRQYRVQKRLDIDIKQVEAAISAEDQSISRTLGGEPTDDPN